MRVFYCRYVICIQLAARACETISRQTSWRSDWPTSQGIQCHGRRAVRLLLLAYGMHDAIRQVMRASQRFRSVWRHSIATWYRSHGNKHKQHEPRNECYTMVLSFTGISQLARMSDTWTWTALHGSNGYSSGKTPPTRPPTQLDQMVLTSSYSLRGSGSVEFDFLMSAWAEIESIG